jgi:hypothetical protein
MSSRLASKAMQPDTKNQCYPAWRRTFSAKAICVTP